ncbi:hypothetical protein LSAT2_009108 [Lamellibrachia satsuma]|nr:hypothetical protein LSAT2_009108 [Lamellibrachia satsuma]
MTTLVQGPSEERSLDDIIQQCQNIITEIRGERPKRPFTEAVEASILLAERSHGKQTLPIAQERSVWRTYHHLQDGTSPREPAAANTARPEMTRQKATGNAVENDSENVCRKLPKINAGASRTQSTGNDKIASSTKETQSCEKYKAGIKCSTRTDSHRNVSPVVRCLSENVSPCSSIRRKVHYSEKCRQAEKSFFVKVTSQFCAINKDIVHTVRDLPKRRHTPEPEVKETTRAQLLPEERCGE